MPWKEVLPMEQRVSFVLEVQKQEKSFAALCRDAEISRKTGYKWWERFRELGLERAWGEDKSTAQESRGE